MEEPAATVRRAAAGDRDAFADLVTAHRAAVLGVARAILRDVHEAEDAAQETFVRAWTRLGDLRDPDRFPAWVRSVARSVSLNRLRRTRDTVRDFARVADPCPGPAGSAETAEFTAAVLVAIRALPLRWRRPIEMVHFEGASLREVAARIGTGESGARSRLSRARRRLAAALAGRFSVETITRGKEARGWLPSRLAPETGRETPAMSLVADSTRRPLPRGGRDVTIRPLRREDLPALRRFDEELEASLDESNAELPPGTGSAGGGPWSRDDWLLAHFEKYEERGNLTLIAEEDGRVVGFADLWVADEPPPFGPSLDVECVDYFREHYLLGLETVLLQEAERVARAAGLPAVDIGSNTASGDYVPLRRSGFRVFYEYDEAVLVASGTPVGPRPEVRPVSPATADLTGLIRVSHWAPTDFGFRDESPWGGGSRLLEIRWPDLRAILELWRFGSIEAHPPVPPSVPDRAELWVSAGAVHDAPSMNDVLEECVRQAREAGAEELPLPVPADVEIDASRLGTRSREFAYAWFRKRLA